MAAKNLQLDILLQGGIFAVSVVEYLVLWCLVGRLCKLFFLSEKLSFQPLLLWTSGPESKDGNH